MQRKQRLILALQLMGIVGLAALVLWALSAVAPAHALPEYAQRTGEPCATCHVNPGGGGPRTLRGALWAARGRPDQVPSLPGVLLAPGVKSGAELYEIGCASCHGFAGEGLFGRELANTGLTAAKIRSNVLRGRAQSGMPAFEGMFTDAQLQALVDYVAALSAGKAEIPPAAYPLPRAEFRCQAQNSTAACGGN